MSKYEAAEIMDLQLRLDHYRDLNARRGHKKLGRVGVLNDMDIPEVNEHFTDDQYNKINWRLVQRYETGDALDYELDALSTFLDIKRVRLPEHSKAHALDNLLFNARLQYKSVLDLDFDTIQSSISLIIEPNEALNPFGKSTLEIELSADNNRPGIFGCRADARMTVINEKSLETTFNLSGRAYIHGRALNVYLDSDLYIDELKLELYPSIGGVLTAPIAEYTPVPVCGMAKFRIGKRLGPPVLVSRA